MQQGQPAMMKEIEKGAELMLMLMLELWGCSWARLRRAREGVTDSVFEAVADEPVAIKV